MTRTNGARTLASRLAADLWRSPWGLLGAWLLAVVSGIRFITSGVVRFTGIPINVAENFGPLFGYLLDGQPITELGPRQYGIVSFLMFDPVIRVFGRDEVALNLWGLGLCLAGFSVAYVLVVRRLAIEDARWRLLLAAGWLAFLPIIAAVVTRLMDVVVLGVLAAFFYWYTRPEGASTASGALAAVGFLIKLLPLIFFPLLLIRERRAFLVGLGWLAGLLAVAHLLYGPLMGFGYPYFLLTETAAHSTDVFSLQNENNSLRGLIFKFSTGYQLDGAHLGRPEHFNEISVAAYLAVFALLVYAFAAIYLHRRAPRDMSRRSIEFAFIVVTMYLAAPHAAHEHMNSMVVVYSILAWLWISGRVPWSWPLMTLGVVSVFLVGVFVPASLLGKAMQLDSVMRALGNEATPLFGLPIGQYDFLGFPGVGLILAWFVMARLEWLTRASGDRSGTVVTT